MLSRFAHWLFRRRLWLLAAFALLTVVMGFFAARVRVDASFNKSLPLDHPYIRTFTQYQEIFGGANRVLIALLCRDGDIFSASFFDQLKKTTDEAVYLSAVDRPKVQSLFTPNVRYVEVVEDGFAGGNVIPANFTPTAENFARVRENIIKSGKLGQLVANDFTGAIISAQLLEVDPRTGRRIDYAKVAAELEAMRVRVARESKGAISVHVIGFAEVVGDIRAGALGVVILFGISVVMTALLVWQYAGRWKLAAAPIACSLLAVIWQLGALRVFGYGIDPFSILVPFLVFAIGVSHGVQKVSMFRNEIFKGHDSRTAAREAFMRLIVPGVVALATDAVGFLTMFVIKIPAIQELALIASLGVSVIVVTNFFLLPILLSYLTLPPSYRAWVAARRTRTDRIWTWLTRAMRPMPSMVIIVFWFSLGAWGWWRGQQIQIGDIQAGVPELRGDSRYNQDTRLIASKFSIGVDVFSVLVETKPNGCVDYDVVALMDRFEGTMRQVPGVQSIVSLPSIAKAINAGYNEGSLKWRILPRNPQALAQVVSPIETATGLLNADASVMPILIFLSDHRAETLRGIVAAVKAFGAEHDSSTARFVLASGNAGVMAAANEVVQSAQSPIVLSVFGAVIALCLLTFRSPRATLCIVAPLAIVSWLAYALMACLGIGLKTSTLPVVALGVGIGVDYGIYLFARMHGPLKAGADFEPTLSAAFKDTGAAIVFTGLTLAVGVSTWIFSALKFQADLGLLLTFMFLVNMLGAIVLLPAMARWLFRPQKK